MNLLIADIKDVAETNIESSITLIVRYFLSLLFIYGIGISNFFFIRFGFDDLIVVSHIHQT
jgi:hypothetical protein